MANLFDIHFTIAPGDLLQAHANHYALMTRIQDVEHRVTDTRFELTVQAFIARSAGRTGFGGITEMQ